MKQLYLIFHCYDVDGGFGDPVGREDLVGSISATPEELQEFLDKYDKSYVYDHPYSDLYAGALRAVPIPKELPLNEDPIPDCRNWGYEEEPEKLEPWEEEEYLRQQEAEYEALQELLYGEE